MSKNTKIILLVLALVAVAAGVYYWWKKDQKKPAPKAVQKPDPREPKSHVLVSDPSNGLNPDLAVNASYKDGTDSMVG